MKTVAPIQDITAAARLGLSGNWIKSTLIMFVYLVLVAICTALIVPLFFMTPFLVGVHAYFLETVRRRDNPFRLLVKGFKRPMTSWLSHLLVLPLILVLSLAVFWLLGIVFLLWLGAMAYGESSSIFLSLILPVMLSLFMSCLLIRILMNYCLMCYIVADDPDIRALQAVRRSVKLMKGNYWRLSGVILASFWMPPYMFAATAAFYLYVKDDQSG